MVVSIGMAKAQHQPRGRRITCDADHGTLDRTLSLHLDPIACSTRAVWTIQPLGDYALEPGDCQPAFRDVDVRGLSNQLQAWMHAIEPAFQGASSLDERHGPEFVPGE